MKPIHTLAAAGLLLLSLAAQSHGNGNHPVKLNRYHASKTEEGAFGREGDPKKVSRTVRLDMSDAMRFTPSDIVVRRGETVKFIVSNSGRQLHEMVLGTPSDLKQHAELMKRFPDMEHADANMTHVKPGARGDIVWQFTKAGAYQFACLIPGHFEAGMVGRVVVK